MIRFRDMTDEMLSAIHCGGCGARGSWFNPPDFCFGKPCLQHDFHYYRGNTEEDRYKADRAFLRFMRRAVGKMPWWRRPMLHALSWAYYKGVRMGGAKSFNFQSRMMDQGDVDAAVTDMHRLERLR